MMEAKKKPRKNSALYSLAAAAVVASEYDTDIKLEILELLLDQRRVARFGERQEETKNGERG